MLTKYLWINGKPIQAVDYTKLYNPYSGEPLAEIPLANEDEVNQAIEAAHNAASVMAHMPSHKRAEILERLAHLLDSHAEEAAVIMGRKPPSQSLQLAGKYRGPFKPTSFALKKLRELQERRFPWMSLPAEKSGLYRL